LDIRVALVADRFGDTGGIGQHSQGLASGLLANGVDVSVYCNIAGPGASDFGDRVHRIGLLTTAEVFASLSAEVDLCLKGLKKADIVHCMAGHGWMVAKLESRLPMVNTVHGRIRWTPREASIRSRMGGAIIRQAELRNIRNSRMVIAVSEKTQDYLLSEFELSPSRVRVISNGMRDAEFTALGSLHSTESSNPTLLCVSRLSAERRPGRILSLARELKAFLPKFRLIVAGGGPLLYLLRKTSIDLRLQESVRFLGDTPRSELLPLYANCDLCIGVPTATLPVLEAAAAGKAFVYFDDEPNIIPSIAGLNSFEGGFGANGEREVARLISSLLTDRDRLNALGMVNKRVVRENYLWSDLAKEVSSVYATCF
jgi:glycosyltransferase involved in cell wall biosynthesis